MPSWPGMAAFPGIVIHAGPFRNVRQLANLNVLVVGPGNSGIDLLGHLASSNVGKLWLSARSGMNITPLRLGGVPLHPVCLDRSIYGNMHVRRQARQLAQAITTPAAARADSVLAP